jgi:hypothetical protein
MLWIVRFAAVAVPVGFTLRMAFLFKTTSSNTCTVTSGSVSQATLPTVFTIVPIVEIPVAKLLLSTTNFVRRRVRSLKYTVPGPPFVAVFPPAPPKAVATPVKVDVW